MHTPCQFEVPWAFAVSWGLELFGGTVVGELRNPATRVAQAEWHILGVAQAKLRNPSCVIRRKSCANVVAQSGEVSESDFILDGINHGLLSTVRGTLQI